MTSFDESLWLQWIDQMAQDDYVIIDDFLDTDLLQVVQSYFQEKIEEDALKKAGIGAQDQHQIASEVRGDFIYWLDKARDISLSNVFQLLNDLKDQLNRYCFLSLAAYEVHLAIYPEGTFYKRHLDQFNNRNNRLISVVIYLNENWQQGDGGELVVYKDEPILIEPMAGRCVLFRSDLIEHEVLRTQKPRKSLTGWMLYQPPVLGQILT